MDESSTLYPRPDYPQPKRRQRFLEIVLLVLIIFIVATMFGPCIPYTPHVAVRTRCLSNLKQQWLAITMYSDDESNRLPPGTNWMDRIAPYIKNEEVFHCTEVAKGAYGYALSSKLAGAKMPKEQGLSGLPLVFDSNDSGRSAVTPLSSVPNPGRHAGRDHIAYADGHTKAIPVGTSD